MSNRMKRMDEAIDLGIELAGAGIAEPHLHVSASLVLSLAGKVDQATWDEAMRRARAASTAWPLTRALRDVPDVPQQRSAS